MKYSLKKMKPPNGGIKNLLTFGSYAPLTMHEWWSAVMRYVSRRKPPSMATLMAVKVSLWMLLLKHGASEC